MRPSLAHRIPRLGRGHSPRGERGDEVQLANPLEIEPTSSPLSSRTQVYAGQQIRQLLVRESERGGDGSSFKRSNKTFP
jgi:hypothetical protein